MWVNDSGHFGTWKKNRWSKSVKRSVCSGRTCTPTHVHPAADRQLIQWTMLMTFIGSNKGDCQPLIHKLFNHPFIFAISYFNLIINYIIYYYYLYNCFKYYYLKCLNITVVIWRFYLTNYSKDSDSKPCSKFDVSLLRRLRMMDSSQLLCVNKLMFNVGVLLVFSHIHSLTCNFSKPRLYYSFVLSFVEES